MAYSLAPTASVTYNSAGPANQSIPWLQNLYAAITASTHWQIDQFSGTLGSLGLTVSPVVAPSSGNFQVNFRPSGTNIVGVTVCSNADITDASTLAGGTGLSPQSNIAAAELNIRCIFVEWADAFSFLNVEPSWKFETSVHVGLIFNMFDGYNATRGNRGLGILQGDPAARNGTTDWFGSTTTSLWNYAEMGIGNWVLCVGQHSSPVAAAIAENGNTVTIPVPMLVGGSTTQRYFGTAKYLRMYTLQTTLARVRDAVNGVDMMVCDDAATGYLLHPVVTGYNPKV